jgi:virulence-associated protein VapD
MKETFKSWNKKTDEEIQLLWDNGLITFDTSVLLGLYRISPSLSNNFFDLAMKLEKRVFVTYHASLEFHRNRFNAIVDNYSALSKLEKEIDLFESSIKDSKFQNYLSEESKKTIEQELKAKRTKITERIKYYETLEKKDIIYERLTNLFDKKVEPSFTKDEIDAINKEGKIRYQDLIPPGYQDDGKTNGNRFGDLIIWKELLRKAKSSNKAIILVTADQKEDWLWIQKDKKKIGPRPELVEEMQKEAKVDFTISSLQNFIISASKTLGVSVEPKQINEEFKFESIFGNKEVVNDSAVAQTNNARIQELQSERLKTSEMIESIIIKPEIDDSEKKLLQDLRLRLEFIDKELTQLQTKTYSK